MATISKIGLHAYCSLLNSGLMAGKNMTAFCNTSTVHVDVMLLYMSIQYNNTVHCIVEALVAQLRKPCECLSLVFCIIPVSS